MYKLLRIMVLSVLLITACSKRHYHSLPPEDSKLSKKEAVDTSDKIFHVMLMGLLFVVFYAKAKHAP